jgi:AcrR family transcriptional regulator
MSAPSRPEPQDAVALGREWFLDCRRIDISALADALGVNRVTLYRWFGTRDRFLVEVVWSLAERALAQIDGALSVEGAERVVELAVGLLHAALDTPGMRRWLADEGEHAMRVLSRHETDFQPRLIAAFERVLREEHAAGRLDLPVELPELAFVIVRLLESYAYLDLITGQPARAQRAEPVLRMLLRADDR